jgi:hypothetical protein
MVLKDGYLFVIFVAFCCKFLGVSRAQPRNHILQKIAKDAKTKLGPKGPAPGDNLSTGRALGWFPKMGISL